MYNMHTVHGDVFIYFRKINFFFPFSSYFFLTHADHVLEGANIRLSVLWCIIGTKANHFYFSRDSICVYRDVCCVHPYLVIGYVVCRFFFRWKNTDVYSRHHQYKYVYEVSFSYMYIISVEILLAWVVFVRRLIYRYLHFFFLRLVHALLFIFMLSVSYVENVDG